MADIAAELGVTESRISQLRAEALKLLRHGLAVCEPQAAPVPEPTGRSGAKIASYAAAVAARGTLAPGCRCPTPSVRCRRRPARSGPATARSPEPHLSIPLHLSIQLHLAIPLHLVYTAVFRYRRTR